MLQFITSPHSDSWADHNKFCLDKILLMSDHYQEVFGRLLNKQVFNNINTNFLQKETTTESLH